MISGYAAQGFPHRALALFQQMQTSILQPSHFTFSAVISVCNALVDFYGNCGYIVDARQVFDKMSLGDAVSWTIIISSYARREPCEEALSLFRQMKQSGFQPCQFVYSGVISACARLGLLEEGVEIHEEIIRKGYEFHISVANALIDMYVKCGMIRKARELFDKIPQRDVVSWTVMVLAYTKQGFAEEALTLFWKMRETGCRPNELTFASVLTAVANMGSLKLGTQFHAEILRCGFQTYVSVANALMDMYAKCGSIEKAQDVFAQMHQTDVVSWNTMTTGLAHNGFLEEALKLFNKMPRRDVISWNAMIAGFMQNGFVEEAVKLFNEMPERSIVSWTTMISGYAHNRFLDEALKLFKEMTIRDTVSWNAMIAGLGHNGYDDEALKLFQQMHLAGVRPNSETFATVLPACAKLAALGHGVEIHEKVIRSGFHTDVLVGNALINMYAKCGDIQKANEIFERMHQRDSVSWTSMITGFAMHGYGKKSLDLFEQMKFSGMTPDHITFLSILSACSHAGLVDEGHKYFDCMRTYYNINPTMEHYRCMVDLLGRAGHLDEAIDFIYKMPVKPNGAIWNCLMGACRIHSNVDLGEYVAGRIFELEPQNAAPYVLLMNIYAAAGRLSEIETIRQMMNDRGVKKTPGYSWNEINEHVNAFSVGERLQTEN
ncbi:pentatricopeptide repeat-containing protein At4g02750-like [Cryptomeria japonica]|uniref:pentatricopeptide repeat-containing protein At4g02750-like n=1 Tax=Cryptomeria japonica TaxID=3369 RepID=UPI0027DA731E|nr:pentatricopeptide repeat-containing protein At4g02750-like [Cryptomeria japonica]